MSVEFENQAPDAGTKNGEAVPFRTRLRMYTIVACATGIGYFGTQWFPIRAATSFTETELDKLIPFSSGWAWVYQTVYIAVPVAALCIERRGHLVHYWRGYWTMLIACLLFFWIYPVQTPRPTEFSASSLDPMHTLILSYDGLINCFPSLHVALALFSVMHARVVLTTRGVRAKWPGIGMWVWFALLCYSTLALKQHYVVDIPAGIAAALVAFYFFSPNYAKRVS